MGRQIAYDFAKEGATVVAVARREERLAGLAAQVEANGPPGTISPYVGDVSARETNDGMIDFAVEKCGKLDILVNNAGIMDGFKPISNISDERWNKVFAVNVKGPIYSMRKPVQVMLGQETKGNMKMGPIRYSCRSEPTCSLHANPSLRGMQAARALAPARGGCGGSTSATKPEAQSSDTRMAPLFGQRQAKSARGQARSLL